MTNQPRGTLARFVIWLLYGLLIATTGSMLMGAGIGIVDGAKVDGWPRAIAAGALSGLSGFLALYLFGGVAVVGTIIIAWLFIERLVPSFEAGGTSALLVLSAVSVAIGSLAYAAMSDLPVWWPIALVWLALVAPTLLLPSRFKQ